MRQRARCWRGQGSDDARRSRGRGRGNRRRHRTAAGASGGRRARRRLHRASTTQATNALLEGDLARVGVLGFARPVGMAGERDRCVSVPLRSATTRVLRRSLRSRSRRRSRCVPAIDALIARGARGNRGQRRVSASIGRSGNRPPSSTRGARRRRDQRPRREWVVRPARAHPHGGAQRGDSPEDAAHARVTAAAVERAAIPAPLMVMRSDGGVMDVAEVERAPDPHAAVGTGGRSRRRAALRAAEREGSSSKSAARAPTVRRSAPAARRCIPRESAATVRCCGRSTCARSGSAAAA